MASYKAFLFALLLISCVIASEAALRRVYDDAPQTIVKKVVRVPSGRTYNKRRDGTIFDAAADIANGILG